MCIEAPSQLSRSIYYSVISFLYFEFCSNFSFLISYLISFYAHIIHILCIYYVHYVHDVHVEFSDPSGIERLSERSALKVARMACSQNLSTLPLPLPLPHHVFDHFLNFRSKGAQSLRVIMSDVLRFQDVCSISFNCVLTWF